jgi:hypothetical protein
VGQNVDAPDHTPGLFRRGANRERPADTRAHDGAPMRAP